MSTFGRTHSLGALAVAGRRHGRRGELETVVPSSSSHARVRPTDAEFLACYREHRDQVFRCALRFGSGRRDFADDLTQEAFLKLIGHWERLEEVEHVASWLYRVTANLAISRLRREQTWRDRLRELLARDEPLQGPPDHTLAQRELASAMGDLIAQLPPKQRVVLVMRVLDDLPQKEIATALDLSEGYVSKLLARARASLRDAGWEVSDD